MAEKKKTESPFIKAETKERRLKLLLWGEPGTGKTVTSLQFPNPVVIDLEKGTELYGNDFKFDVQSTNDADRCMFYVDWLLANKHDYRTLIIDPITVYWAAVQDKYRAIFMERKQGSKGFKIDFYEFQRNDWNTMKSEYKRFTRKLIKLDMNIIVTAHQKTKFAEDGSMTSLGDTFDSEKKTGHDFDCIIQTYVKDNEFWARVYKQRAYSADRLLPKEFPLSYEPFAQYLGDNNLNRKSEPTPLATPEQVQKIRDWYLNASAPVGVTGVQKLLRRYDVSTEEDLTEVQATEILGKFEDAYKKRQEKANAGS